MGNQYLFRIRLAFIHSPLRITDEPVREEALEKGFRFLPSETLFLVSEEVLKLPYDIQAVISPSNLIKDEGLRMIGELELEPLFNGRVLLGLHNESRSAFSVNKELVYAESRFENILGEELSGAAAS